MRRPVSHRLRQRNSIPFRTHGRQGSGEGEGVGGGLSSVSLTTHHAPPIGGSSFGRNGKGSGRRETSGWAAFPKIFIGSRSSGAKTLHTSLARASPETVHRPRDLRSSAKEGRKGGVGWGPSKKILFQKRQGKRRMGATARPRPTSGDGPRRHTSPPTTREGRSRSQFPQASSVSRRAVR